MLDLTAGLVLHALLGVVLAGVVWAVGLGTHPARRVFAYPVGLLVVVVAAFLTLVTPWLSPVSVVLVVALLIRARPAFANAVGRVRSPVLWALPGALALPVALGSHLHGPTAELDSNAYGDMLFYAAKLVSAHESVFPFRDLLVEGESSAYVEAGTTFLGAALAWLPGFDPILFQTTTMPAFLLTSVPIGLGLLGRRPGSPDAERWLPVTGLLAATMIAYPTWVTESPPVAATLPLAFSLYVIACERLPLWQLVGVASACAVDFVLTKGFGGVVLLVIVGYAFARDHLRELDTRRALALGGAAALLAGGAAAFLFGTSGWLTDILDTKFLPETAVNGLVDQLDGRDTQKAAPGFELAGSLLLLLALVRARAWPFVAAFSAALVGHWFVGGHGLDILVGTSILLAAVLFWRNPDLLWRQRYLLLAAAALLAISAWFRDISGVRAGFVFVVLLAAGLVGAFAERRALYTYAVAASAVLVGLTGRSLVAFLLLLALLAVGALAPRLRWAAAGIALAGALAVAAVSDLALTPFGPVLTTEDYEVWRQVEEQVPPDGLVFTSLTGPVISGEQGWNYYPGLAGRQLYVAGWSNSPLFVDEDARAERLRLNREVLEGRLRPDGVPLDRTYPSSYAVLRVENTPPPRFERLYGNERFELYRIP